MSIKNVTELFTGIALFPFGMSLMGEGLKQVSGKKKLEMILYRLTDSPWKGALFGAGITTVIQSSSALSIMAVGFVNSGIMKIDADMCGGFDRCLLAYVFQKSFQESSGRSIAWLCCPDVWNVHDESGDCSFKRESGFYQYSHKVFQSTVGDFGRCRFHNCFAERICCAWHFTGSHGNWNDAI